MDTKLPVGWVLLLAVALIAVCTPGEADSPGSKANSPCGPGGPAIKWDEKIEVASGDAFRGPWRMNKSKFNFVDDPTVAINEQGYVGVAWADHPKLDVYFQLYAPDGEAQLEEPVNVSASPNIFSWLPRMVITSDHPMKVYLLWQEIVFSGGSHGGEIFFARSTDGGKSFRGSVNLSNTTAGAGKGRLTAQIWHNGSLDLAMSPQGNLYAAWTEYEGPLWFSRSTDGGESFSDPLRIGGGNDTNPARGPSLAVNDDGTIYLAWTVGEDRAADIRFAKSDDDGRSFGEPQIVFESGGHADAPKLAVDGKGTVHLVYAESAAGPFRRYHVRYTRLIDGANTFDEPRKIAGPHGEQFESVSFPALSLDGKDRLYVIWELFPNRRGQPRGLGLTYSSDGGETFASPSIVPGTADPAFGFNGSQQGLLMRKLAVNEAGAIAVVNSTFRANETSRIRLFRGRATERR
jgi:hypothetical protein